MISDSTMQRIRDVSITDIVQDVVKLKKNTGCCPFHDEKTGSFHVNIAKGIFKCFGCGKSGDGIRFVQEYYKLSFYEALEKIARAHNISIEYIDNYTPEQRAQRKEKLEVYKDILAYCHHYYQQALQENEAAKNYLLERDIDDDCIADKQLGYAPEDWQSVVPHIVERGWHTAALELGVIGTTNGKNWDMYRNRIIIPITDKYGQLVGFAGRVLNNDKPKYINPCASEMYIKQDLWYGWNEAIKAVQNENNVYVVEGYLDVIQLHRRGVLNTIASCGTEISDKQIKTLIPWTTTVTVMYDGDSAGQSKIRKLVQQIVKYKLHAQVCILPAGEDPDDMAKKFPAENQLQEFE